MKVISSVQEQQRILKACHSDATYGDFGVTKTQTDCREVLLERNGCRCEKVGKQCVVYITFWQAVKDNLIVHAPNKVQRTATRDIKANNIQYDFCAYR